MPKLRGKFFHPDHDKALEINDFSYFRYSDTDLLLYNEIESIEIFFGPVLKVHPYTQLGSDFEDDIYNYSYEVLCQDGLVREFTNYERWYPITKET